MCIWTSIRIKSYVPGREHANFSSASCVVAHCIAVCSQSTQDFHQNKPVCRDIVRHEDMFSLYNHACVCHHQNRPVQDTRQSCGGVPDLLKESCRMPAAAGLLRLRRYGQTDPSDSSAKRKYSGPLPTGCSLYKG